MSDDEAARAIEYRAAIRRRNAYRMAQESALRGNPNAAIARREAWEPIINRNVPIPDIPEYGLDEEEDIQ